MKRRPDTASQPSNKTNDTDSPNQQANLPNNSLVYLEDIHIFALANLLQRPIIVLAQEFYKNIEPIRLRGIYLPLLTAPKHCVKDPILIAYNHNHFVPLMFALDSRDIQRFDKVAAKRDHRKQEDECEYEIDNSSRYFHFANVDLVLESRHLASGGYPAAVDEFIRDKSRDRTGQLGSFRKHDQQFYNVLPLEYHDLTSMRAHFLTEDESRRDPRKLLSDYLNLVILEIAKSSFDFDTDVIRTRAAESNTDPNTYNLLCCYLNRSTNLHSEKNGVSIYLDFLSESMRRNQSQLASSVRRKTSGNAHGSGQGSRRGVAVTNENYAPVVAASSAVEYQPRVVASAAVRCRNETSGCSRDGNSRYQGFCMDCFRQNLQELNTDTSFESDSDLNQRVCDFFYLILCLVNF
jgi:hypothetical protein